MCEAGGSGMRDWAIAVHQWEGLFPRPLSVVCSILRFAACAGGGGRRARPTRRSRPRRPWPSACREAFRSESSRPSAAGSRRRGASTATSPLNDGAWPRGVTWTATCHGGTLAAAFTARQRTGERRSRHLHRPGKPPGQRPDHHDQSHVIIRYRRGSGSANIACAAIHVSIDPAGSNVECRIKSGVHRANVENDSTDGGVTWAITPESGAGTLEKPDGPIRDLCGARRRRPRVMYQSQSRVHRKQTQGKSLARALRAGPDSGH
jgi:hypothetical protein